MVTYKSDITAAQTRVVEEGEGSPVGEEAGVIALLLVAEGPVEGEARQRERDDGSRNSADDGVEGSIEGEGDAQEESQQGCARACRRSVFTRYFFHFHYTTDRQFTVRPQDATVTSIPATLSWPHMGRQVYQQI